MRQKRTYIKRDVLEEQARKQQEELDAVKRAEEDARGQQGGIAAFGHQRIEPGHGRGMILSLNGVD